MNSREYSSQLLPQITKPRDSGAIALHISAYWSYSDGCTALVVKTSGAARSEIGGKREKSIGPNCCCGGGSVATKEPDRCAHPEMLMKPAKAAHVHRCHPRMPHSFSHRYGH